jgi:hypothetical protein
VLRRQEPLTGIGNARAEKRCVRSVIALAFCVVAFGGLTAQTPAPAPSASKPLRHLEYKFTDDFEGVSEYHFNGIGNGIQTSSGVGDVSSSIGGRGTMSVDILSVTPDGALVVKISESVENEPHPRGSYTCTVYGSTAVLCPSVPAPSDAEWVLLSYLGRQFVAGAPWDAQRHWQRKQDTPRYLLVEDFTLTDATNDKQTLIREKKKMSLHNGGFGSQTEDVAITYDQTMEVPTVVHDEVQSVGTAGSGHGTYDFHLTSDSFAKAPP